MSFGDAVGILPVPRQVQPEYQAVGFLLHRLAEFYHRVHVTSWLGANAAVHAVPTPGQWPDRPDWRWTVDTYEDLAMARSAFRVFGPRAASIDYPAMVECLDAHPEICAMNAHIEQKKPEEG